LRLLWKIVGSNDGCVSLRVLLNCLICLVNQAADKAAEFGFYLAFRGGFRAGSTGILDLRRSLWLGLRVLLGAKRWDQQGGGECERCFLVHGAILRENSRAAYVKGGQTCARVCENDESTLEASVALEGGIPRAPEIRKQLARMLDSRTFRINPSRAKVLELVVTSVLEGKEITRRDLESVLFPKGHYDPGTSVGRSTASNLRETLTDYYKGDGAEDLVRIELPPGPGYKPTFSYHATSKAQLACSRGNALLTQMLPKEAANHFLKAMGLEPDYMAPYLGLAEANLASPFCSEIFQWCWSPLSLGVPQRNAAARLVEVRALLEACVRIGEDLWHVHAVTGAMYSYEHQWDKAELAFRTALKLSADDTQYYPWYLAFLAARGRLTEALEIMEGKVQQECHNPAVLVHYGFLLYAARQFSEAHRAFADAQGIVGRDYFPAVVGLACLCAQSDDGLGARAFMRTLNREGRFPSCFPGLFILALVLKDQIVRSRDDRIKEAREKLEEMKELYVFSAVYRPKLRPIQFALAHIGLGHTDEAVKALSEAADECDPMVMWLHILPIFDPLRGDEEFDALVKRIGLLSPSPSTL